MNDNVYCGDCGQPNPATNKFCGHCGQPIVVLSATDKQNTTPVKPVSRPKTDAGSQLVATIGYKESQLWQRNFIRAGLSLLPRNVVQAINDQLTQWESAPPALGSIKDEIEVLALPIRGDKSRLIAVAKFLVLDNEETKVHWCSVTRLADREIWAVIDNGFLLFTNARLFLYSKDGPGRVLLGQLVTIEQVEVVSKGPSVLLYSADNVIEIALQLPRASAATNMASIDYDDKTHYAAFSKLDREKLEARGRDVLSLIVSFLSESCTNARALAGS